MSAANWAQLILLSILWGGSFFFNEIALVDLPTLTVVLGRLALGAVALVVTVRVLGVALPASAAVWRAFFFMGLLNNAVPFTLIVWGQVHLASGIAAVLNATTPMFTVLVAHFATSDERLSAARVAGVVAGFAGVAAMMAGGPPHEQVPGSGWLVLAHVAVVGAACSYAFAAVYGRRFKAMGVAPLAVATGQVTASSLILLPLVLLVDQPWTLSMPGVPAIGALVAIAVLSTALAYVLYFRILSSAGATNLSLVTFLVPVSAIALGVLFLGESLESHHLIGIALIAAGLVVIDGRLLRRRT